jgi:hypothetical protein
MCKNPANFLEISSFVDFFQNIIEFVTTFFLKLNKMACVDYWLSELKMVVCTLKGIS